MVKKKLRAQKWRFLVNTIFVKEKPNKIVSRTGRSYTDHDFGLLWSNVIVSRDYNANAGWAFSSFAGASVLRWRRSELLLCDRWSFGRACNRRRSESHQNNLLWGFIDLSERQCLKTRKKKNTQAENLSGGDLHCSLSAFSGHDLLQVHKPGWQLQLLNMWGAAQHQRGYSNI